MACETLCQKMEVNVIKKQRILKKVGSLLPQQFSKTDEEETWSRAVSNCLPWDYCCIPPKQYKEATARYGDLGKMDAPSSWLSQFLSPEGPLMAQPGERQPSECHLEKALLLQCYRHQNQQTKNRFRKKMCLFGAHHQTGREPNGKILPPALQHIPRKHCCKKSPSNPLGFNAMKTCAKNAWGQLHLYLFIIFSISVFIRVLMAMIGCSGCIPLLITGMSESYFAKNVFLSSPAILLLSP